MHVVRRQVVRGGHPQHPPRPGCECSQGPARLDRRLSPGDRREMERLAGGLSLGDIARGIVEAIDPDRQVEATGLVEERVEGRAADAGGGGSANAGLARSISRMKLIRISYDGWRRCLCA